MAAGAKDQITSKVPFLKKTFKSKDKDKDKDKNGGKISAVEKMNCGKLTTYGESQRNGALFNEWGEKGKLDRDHIPASSYMLLKAEKDIQNGDYINDGITSINPCMKKAIVCEASVIIVPRNIHSLGHTYGVDSATTIQNGDLDKSPNVIAKRDVKAYKKALKTEDPYKGNKKLTDKQKKNLKNESDACKKKIKDNLEIMEKENFDKSLKDKIIQNKECNKAWAGKKC